MVSLALSNADCEHLASLADHASAAARQAGRTDLVDRNAALGAYLRDVARTQHAPAAKVDRAEAHP